MSVPVIVMGSDCQWDEGVDKRHGRGQLRRKQRKSVSPQGEMSLWWMDGWREFLEVRTSENNTEQSACEPSLNTLSFTLKLGQLKDFCNSSPYITNKMIFL